MTLAFVERREPAPDTEILQRMRDGDHAAYVVLYERYVGSAVRLAHSILRSDDVDDIVAEVFAASFAAIQRGKGPVDDFGPYLFSAVRRECYRASRRRSRRRESPTEPAAVEQVGARDDVGDATERAVLSQAFDALPAHMRTVLWLTEVEGLSHAVVAKRTRSTPQAVAALAMRSRRSLAEHYLQAHLGETAGRGPTPRECREARQALAQIVRRTASGRQERRVSAHLAACAECAHARDQLRLVNQRLRTLPPPAILGTIGLSQVVGLGLRARLATLLLGPVAPLTAASTLFVAATTLPSAVPVAVAAPPAIAAPTDDGQWAQRDGEATARPTGQRPTRSRSATTTADAERAPAPTSMPAATSMPTATSVPLRTSTPSTSPATAASSTTSQPAIAATRPPPALDAIAPPDVSIPVTVATRPSGASVSVAVPSPVEVVPLPDVDVAVSATQPSVGGASVDASLETGGDGIAVGGGAGPVEAEASVTPDDVEVSVDGVDGVDELLPPATGGLLPGL